MNKSELIEITAKEAVISKAAAEKALSAAMAAIVKAVSKGDAVTLVGFGSFKSSKRAARVGRNPQSLVADLTRITRDPRGARLVDPWLRGIVSAADSSTRSD